MTGGGDTGGLSKELLDDESESDRALVLGGRL